MSKPRRGCLFGVLLTVMACYAVLLFLPTLLLQGRPWPFSQRTELYPGVVHYRRFHTAPRFYVVNVITIELSNPHISFYVTPPADPVAELPLYARTTAQFLEEFGAQIAINGDGFTPWHSTSSADYYPHVGDPIRPNGFAASNGVQYGSGAGPTLYISAMNEVAFNDSANGSYNAVSGDRMLVRDRQPVADLPDDIPAPRSAVGVDRGGNRLILMVVDGRQPFYSLGVTLKELADLMIYYGADEALNLDGGGSSTLVIQDASGNARVLNSPIDNYIAGRERPVGNHLGVFIK